MTEIRTIQDYKRFIDEMAPFHKPDNLMINFIHSFNSIAVGCSCKRKARIRAANMRKNDSMTNLPESFIEAVRQQYLNLPVFLYQDENHILTIEK